MRVESVYCLYVALTTLGLAATVTAYVPFLQSIGLTLGEVGLINAGFWIVYALMELPTGMVADGRSRTWSVKRGVALQALGALGYYCASGFWSAVAAEAVLGVGMAFTSGAHQAWLVDALKAEGRAGDARRAFGTAAMVRGLCMVAGGLCGSLLPRFSPSAIWLPYAVLAVPAWLLVRYRMDGRGDPERRVTEREALAKSLSLLCDSRALRWSLAAFVLSGLVLPFNHYWSPYFIAAYGEANIGLVWTLMYLSLIPGGWVVRRLRVPVSREPSALAGALACAGLGMAFIPAFGGTVGPLAAVVLHEAARGAFEPLLEAFTHHRVDSDHRATYASLQSLIGKAGFSLVPLAVWASIHGMPDAQDTIALVWASAGGLLAALALFLWAFRPNGH